MNELIQVSASQISGETVKTVNARDLHAFLEAGKDFSTWIKDRIEKYGFVEGEDYATAEELSAPKSGSAMARPQRTIAYHLTLNMAKELAMVERNERGRQARHYFIECERRLIAANDSIALPDFTDPAAAAIAWAEQFKAKQALALENAAQASALAIAAPKAAALDRIAVETEGSVCLRVAAKLAKVPEKQFLNFLSSERWIFRHHHSNTWLGYRDKEQALLLELKKTMVTRNDGSEKTVERVLVTPKGLAKVVELIERKAPWLHKSNPPAPKKRPDEPDERAQA